MNANHTPTADSKLHLVEEDATRRIVAGRVFQKAIEEDLDQLAEALLAQAVSGNMEAARLVLAYCVGTPREAPDVDLLAKAERILEEHRQTVKDIVAEVSRKDGN